MCDDPVAIAESATIRTTTSETAQTSYRRKRSLNESNGTTTSAPTSRTFLIQTNSTNTSRLTLDVNTDEVDFKIFF